jgi:hypothetical protein
VSQITGKPKLAAPLTQNALIFSRKTPYFSRIAPNSPTIAAVSSHPQRASNSQNPPHPRRVPSRPLPAGGRPAQKLGCSVQALLGRDGWMFGDDDLVSMPQHRPVVRISLMAPGRARNLRPADLPTRRPTSSAHSACSASPLTRRPQKIPPHLTGYFALFVILELSSRKSERGHRTLFS